MRVSGSKMSAAKPFVLACGLAGLAVLVSFSVIWDPSRMTLEQDPPTVQQLLSNVGGRAADTAAVWKAGKRGRLHLTEQRSKSTKELPLKPATSTFWSDSRAMGSKAVNLHLNKPLHTKRARKGSTALPGIAVSRWPWDSKLGTGHKQKTRLVKERLEHAPGNGPLRRTESRLVEAASDAALRANKLRIKAKGAAQRMQAKLRKLQSKVLKLKSEMDNKRPGDHTTNPIESKQELDVQNPLQVAIVHQGRDELTAKFPVLSISEDRKKLVIAAPNDGSFPIGAASLRVETASGGQGIFPYLSATAHEGTTYNRLQDEHYTHGPDGILFSAGDGVLFPLNAAYAAPVPLTAQYPVSRRSANGKELQVIGSNDGQFAPGPGVVTIKLKDSAEMEYRYRSMRAVSGEGKMQELLFTASHGTFPAAAAFVSPSLQSGCQNLKAGWWDVWSENFDHTELKVQAKVSEKFSLGNGAVFVKTKDGGCGTFAYARMAQGSAQWWAGEPAGLLFFAPLWSRFPSDAELVHPVASTSPYPVISVSHNGRTMEISAGQDQAFFPAGPSHVSVSLADGTKLSFPYSSAGLTRSGKVVLQAPQGVRYPASSSFAGPSHPLTKEEEPNLPLEVHKKAPLCSHSGYPAEQVSFLTTKSSTPSKLSTACIHSRVYVDNHVRFQNLPGPLIGQTLIQTSDSDRKELSEDYMSFSVESRSFVYLLWDSAGTPENGGSLPYWVEEHFADSGLTGTSTTGNLEIFISKQPFEGLVWLGGCSASGSTGASHNFGVIVVPAKYPIAVAFQHPSQWQRHAESIMGYQQKVGKTQTTWLQSTFEVEPTLRVTYESPFGTSLRVSNGGETALPSRSGFIVTAVSSSEPKATVGQHILFETVHAIEPGFDGYPGLVLYPRKGTKFPIGVKEIRPTELRVLSVRPGGMQAQTLHAASEQFPNEAFEALVTRTDGSTKVVRCQSVSEFAGLHAPTTLITAAPGHFFPENSKFVAPADTLAQPPPRSFPIQGNFSESWMETSSVLWESSDRTKLRLSMSSGLVYPPKMGTIVALTKNGEEHHMQYATATKDAPDAHGNGGWLLTLPCCGIHFPKDVHFARPMGFSVVGLRRDGAQMQVAASREDVIRFKGGTVRVWIAVSGSGIPVLEVAYESISVLPDGEGLLFTVVGSNRFPLGAALIQPIHVAATARNLHYPKRHVRRPNVPYRHSKVPWLEQHPTGAVVVLNQKAMSGMPVTVGIAEEGARLFDDREWRMRDLPSEYSGDVMLSTSDSDAKSRGAGTLQFDINVPCHIIVLRPGTQQGNVPYWLSSGFSPTGERVKIETAPGFEPFSMDVYRSKTPMSGTVRLGGNLDFPAKDLPPPVANYMVLLKPSILEDASSTSYEKSRNTSEVGKEEVQQKTGTRHGPYPKGLLLTRIAAVRHACGTPEQANQCLAATQACLFSFHSGAPDSCSCFESNSHSGESQTWVGKSWCTASCKLALMREYEQLVLQEKNHILDCRKHVEY